MDTASWDAASAEWEDVDMSYVLKADTERRRKPAIIANGKLLVEKKFVSSHQFTQLILVTEEHRMGNFIECRLEKLCGYCLPLSCCFSFSLFSGGVWE